MQRGPQGLSPPTRDQTHAPAAYFTTVLKKILISLLHMYLFYQNFWEVLELLEGQTPSPSLAKM